MKEKEKTPALGELPLDEELLHLSCLRAQGQARCSLRRDSALTRRRTDRRHFLAFALLMLLLLLPATGLLTAHRFPYVMKVPAGADREAVNLSTNQIIALL